jgi:Fe-S-cluster-containing dehydrogenase component
MAQKGWLIQLDKCIGCETCAIACKSENNTRPLSSPLPFKNGRGVIPEHVSYRWVVKIEAGAYPSPIVTFVTSSCNHCQHPACIASCPVPGAIFKRAEDGIVLIDQTKCVGCRNCVQACPYGAPQYNVRTGKVEKCTLCLHRLQAGLLPACVTTCVGNALHMVDDFQAADSGVNAPPFFADPAATTPSVKFETSAPAAVASAATAGAVA